MNDLRVKPNHIQWMICLNCKSLITVRGFILDHSNDLLIKYSCQCPLKYKIKSLHKYLYGINLMQGFGCGSNVCDCNISLGSYYCLKCDTYVCVDCYKYHKNHLISRYFFNYVSPICKEHNRRISYMCLRCSISICDQCTSHIKHNYKDVHDYYSYIEVKMLNKYNMNGSTVIKEMLNDKNIKLSKENEDDLIKVYTILSDSLRKSVHYPHISVPLSLNCFMNITVNKTPKIKYNKIPILKGPITKTFFFSDYLVGKLKKIDVTNRAIPIDQIIPLNNGRFLLHFCSFYGGTNYIGPIPRTADEKSNYGEFLQHLIIYSHYFQKIETCYPSSPVVGSNKKDIFLLTNFSKYQIFDCSTIPIKELGNIDYFCPGINFVENNVLYGHYKKYAYKTSVNLSKIKHFSFKPISKSMYYGNDTIIVLLPNQGISYNFTTNEEKVLVDLTLAKEEYSITDFFLSKSKIIFIGTCRDGKGFDLIVDFHNVNEQKLNLRKRDFVPLGFTPGPEGYGFYISNDPQIITINLETGVEVAYTQDEYQFDEEPRIRIFPIGYEYYIYQKEIELGLYHAE